MSADAPSPADSLPTATRHRLQQVFEHANRSLEKGDYAYAHDLYSQCVAEDPSVLVYLQHFRANLAQMHPNGGKKRSTFGSLTGMGSGRGLVAKAAAKGEWQEAFTTGCAALKKNPADTDTLCEMADVCGERGHADSQLYYLRWALDLAPSDLDINRQAALALEAIDQFDQAISCWLRIQQQKPGDEEASKAISRISVEKTIDQGGYDPALLSPNAGDVVVQRPGRVANLATSAESSTSDEAGAAAASEEDLPQVEQEQKLRAAVDTGPTDAAPYVALADFYTAQSRLTDAERLYRKAIQVGGEDLEVLEKLEEVYLTRMRHRAAVATQRSQSKPSDEAAQLARAASDEANRAEAEVFAARVERSPKDPQLNFELGLRLKRLGQHREAIEPLQAAREDLKRVAEAHLLLGECFQQIGQHALAGRSYEASIAACPQDEWFDLRKLATYRAGVLAMGMQEFDRAETHLTDLAAADFGYRDVGERLDKIAKIRNDT